MYERETGEIITVDSVKAKDRGVRVTLSTGDKVTLSVDSFTEFHLYSGKELSDAEFKSILDFAAQDEAYDRALHYLAQDAYSVMEIQRKLLAKGYEFPMVRQVIDRLVQTGLLNDETFAKTYAADVADLRLVGHNRVVYDLRAKGISEDIIRTLEFPAEAELRKAKECAKALDKKYYRVPNAKRALKIHAALLSRGFDGDIAHEAAKECVSATDPAIERVELEKAYALAKAKYSRKYEGYALRDHIHAYLVRKGFSYDEIQQILEDEE